MNKIEMKPHHNYVAFFLTLGCNMTCSYCLNNYNNTKASKNFNGSMDADKWIEAANRLVLRPDLPLTLQGGEPTLYKGFYQLVNDADKELKMDLLTNLQFDIDRFIAEVPRWRFERDAPYASIRVSYHHGYTDQEKLLKNTLRLMKAGFRIGLYAIEIPDKGEFAVIQQYIDRCKAEGIDFRTKEFLGDWKGTTYGTFKYEESVAGARLRSCACKTSELLVGPSGDVFRCHSDLYNNRAPYAHIADSDFSADMIDEYRNCDFYGDCNPCDVKVKTNRFQIFGHTSVDIKDVK